jgi:hypothetical protein
MGFFPVCPPMEACKSPHFLPANEKQDQTAVIEVFRHPCDVTS